MRTSIPDSSIRPVADTAVACMLSAGKWHLDGLHSVGMGGGPILANHSHNPSAFGFSYWVSSFGVFEVDPLLSRMGQVEDFVGDSSDVVVDEALKWMREQAQAAKPALTVIWYPSPHEPWVALPADRAAAKGVFKSRYYGEVVAMDRSIGTLRRGIREMGVENTTLLWFNSDNGGMHGLPVPTNGGLRGYKKEIFEGGIRVSGIVEWSGTIAPGRITWYPTCIYDLFPTVVELLGLPQADMLRPHDGSSLVRLFSRDIPRRHKPIIITYKHRWALIDNEIKYMTSGAALTNSSSQTSYFYNLSRHTKAVDNSSRQLNRSLMVGAIFGNEEDQDESFKRAALNFRKEAHRPSNRTHDGRVFHHMMWLRSYMADFMASVNASRRGRDYPGGRIGRGPGVHVWCDTEQYRPYLSDILARPQHRNELRHLIAANFSWWRPIYKAIDRNSYNLNKTRRPKSRFEQLGGYLHITG